MDVSKAILRCVTFCLLIIQSFCSNGTDWLNAENNFDDGSLHRGHGGIGKRLVSGNDKLMWDHGIIPYKFADVLPNTKASAYMKYVFPVYEKYSCIRFVPWTSETKRKYLLNHNNYLSFSEHGSKCQSYLGNAKKNGQVIFCCKAQTCIHEVGHALGFPHEQQNPLRDGFTRVNYQNVKPGLEFSFVKSWYNMMTYGIYDIDSIMHYAFRTFSKNLLKTIDVLDKDARPVSAFADREAYYYFFYEINQRYKCADHCDLECYNGGYKALLDGQCGCRCPQGLDPSTQCAEVDKTAYDCGGIINLSDNKPIEHITSPAISSSDTVTCTWYIQGPPKSKLFLDFPEFNVRKSENNCVDEVAVRYYLPGLFGAPFCGDVFPRVIQSFQESMVISFTQTTGGSSKSSFKATISMVKDEDLCYDVQNKGRNYDGPVDYAENFSPCLPWEEVRHCPNSLFNPNDFGSNLEGAKCRNPDGSDRPWCYTESELCQRAYCDSCQQGACKDIFSNCAEEISSKPNYCTKDPSATRGCRRSCGHCNGVTPLPKVSSVTCPVPTKPSDAQDVSLKQSYKVGEAVTFTCSSDSKTSQTITCLSSGNWTSLNYVCGACDEGWVQYKNHCYQLYNSKVKHDSAKTYCAKLRPGASLFTEHTEDVHEFIVEAFKSETGKSHLTWMGITRKDGKYIWTSGTPELTYTNWASGHPSSKKNNCVLMAIDFTWKDKGCGMKFKAICQYKLTEPEVCADQRQGCAELLERNPDLCTDNFAYVHCARTCSICSMTAPKATCVDEGLSMNADIRSTPTIPGHSIVYTCRVGFKLVTGDLLRTCTTSGQLTGSPPQCLDHLKYNWPVNTVAIRDRGSVGKPGRVYFANNQHFTIPVKGKIMRWFFYSKFDGQVALQVWRKTSSSTVYEFRGQNIIRSTMEDRERDVLFKEAERVWVKDGDLIAVYYSGSQHGGIPFDRCASAWNPTDLKQLVSVNYFGSPKEFTFRKTYKFILKAKECRQFSLNALIDSK